MSNDQTQEWLLAMEEEFYCANNRKKQIKVLDALREHGFSEYADDWERDLLCEDCNGKGVVTVGEFDDIQEVLCICVKEALQDKEMQEI